jgi:nucleoside-specific channel-forming protein
VGRQLSYIGFTNFDWGSDLGDNDFRDLNGKKARTNNSIASSHILALNYDHWHYSVVARYWHNGGQERRRQPELRHGDFSVRSTGGVVTWW